MRFQGFAKRHAFVLDLVNRVIDVVLVGVSGVASYWIFYRSLDFSYAHKAAVTVGVLLALALFRWFPIYRSWRGKHLLAELHQIVLAWFSLFLVLVMTAFVTRSDHFFDFTWVVLWWLLGLTLLIWYRLVLRVSLGWLRQRGSNQRSVVIIGWNDNARDVMNQLKGSTWTGLRVVAIFDERSNRRITADVPIFNQLDRLVDLICEQHIDQVWICVPLSEKTLIRQIVQTMRTTTALIRYVPSLFGAELFAHTLTDVAGIQVVDLNPSPMDGGNILVKAIEDKVVASIALVFAAPVMCVIALAIKLTSPGPVLFKQLRHGWRGQAIVVYKFRTMAVHQGKQEVTQASQNDPRVTPVGRFLRRTSFDELPQLFNVLLGTMSVVGPRPHAIPHNQFYMKQIDAYMQRHCVKPGITGWAQINGWRGETDTLDKMSKRVEYDLYYINHWSIWFDLRIIALTLVKGFTGKNAY